MHSRCVRNKETTWHVWWDAEIWSLCGFDLTPLGVDRPLPECWGVDAGASAETAPCAKTTLDNRQCAILKLRYHDGTEMRVMVMKNLRGTTAADHTLQLPIVKRQEISLSLFEFLATPITGANMVLGDLGVGLPT